MKPRIPRRDIVAEARTWTGTPYRHQQSKKNGGVDCVGLIRGVGSELGILEISAEAWRPFKGYARLPNPRRMEVAMNEFLVPRAGPALGAIAWIEWRENLPMHLGILSDHPVRDFGMIHAYSNMGKCVEHGFSNRWQRRTVSYWDFPGLED